MLSFEPVAFTNARPKWIACHWSAVRRTFLNHLVPKRAWRTSLANGWQHKTYDKSEIVTWLSPSPFLARSFHRRMMWWMLPKKYPPQHHHHHHNAMMAWCLTEPTGAPANETKWTGSKLRLAPGPQRAKFPTCLSKTADSVITPLPLASSFSFITITIIFIIIIIIVVILIIIGIVIFIMTITTTIISTKDTTKCSTQQNTRLLMTKLSLRKVNPYQ